MSSDSESIVSCDDINDVDFKPYYKYIKTKSKKASKKAKAARVPARSKGVKAKKTASKKKVVQKEKDSEDEDPNYEEEDQSDDGEDSDYETSKKIGDNKMRIKKRGDGRPGSKPVALPKKASSTEKKRLPRKAPVSSSLGSETSEDDESDDEGRLSKKDSTKKKSSSNSCGSEHKKNYSLKRARDSSDSSDETDGNDEPQNPIAGSEKNANSSKKVREESLNLLCGFSRTPTPLPNPTIAASSETITLPLHDIFPIAASSPPSSSPSEGICLGSPVQLVDAGVQCKAERWTRGIQTGNEWVNSREELIMRQREVIIRLLTDPYGTESQPYYHRVLEDYNDVLRGLCPLVPTYWAGGHPYCLVCRSGVRGRCTRAPCIEKIREGTRVMTTTPIYGDICDQVPPIRENGKPYHCSCEVAIKKP